MLRDSRPNIRDEVDGEANIIFGSTFDETMEGSMRVSVVATGIDAEIAAQRPVFNANNNVYTQQQNVAGQHVQKQVDVAETKPVEDTPKTSYQTREVGFGLGGATNNTSTGVSASAPSTAGGFTRGDMGSIPASVIPQTSQPGLSPVATAATPATTSQSDLASRLAQPVAHAPQGGESFQYGTATMMQASQPTAAAVKQDARLDVTATHTKPLNLGISQARGQRQGNAFIPPKPYTAEDDLFAAAESAVGVSAEEKSALRVTEPTGPAATTPPVRQEKPGFFERLTGHRRNEVSSAPSTDGNVSLNVQSGGKKEDEDELDIPAFLRRQAN